VAHVSEVSQSLTCHLHVYSINGMSHTCLYFPAAEHLCALSGTHFHLLDLVGSRLISSPSLVADKMLS